MCGINGKIYLKNGEVLEKDLLKMNQTIKHRGPDDEGVYLSPNKKVGLGHLRLSILDLSPLGHQPMSYLNRYYIVFNGEIYNFQEKKKSLEKEGYRFKSQTDTEVILALYAKYKKHCLKHLRGMFAFAIYDQKEQTLFCARDRVGKKPFKYYFNHQVFLFSSELKALINQKECPKKPDFSAIHHFLSFYCCPNPLTGFQDIQKLEPGHSLFLDLKKGTLKKEKYWEIDFLQKENRNIEEWKTLVLQKLEESVKLRLISDVPLGAFLSGGVDSSSVVGLMSKLSSKKIKTFSVGFKEKKFSELQYASIIAKKFQTEHTEIIVEKENLEDILPKLVQLYEEPYADNSAVPTYYLSRETKKKVSVALNGDGGDENFFGYSWYRKEKLANFLAFFNGNWGKYLALPFNYLHQNFLQHHFLQKIGTFFQSLPLHNGEKHILYLSRLLEKDKRSLYHQNQLQQLEKLNTSPSNDSALFVLQKMQQASSLDHLEQSQFADWKIYLADDLLPKVDLATMAWGLEGRSPFLDHEFMELVAKIPVALKLQGLETKSLLKKALLQDGFIPPEILYRKKMGFVMPIQSWFKNEKDFQKYTKNQILEGPLVKNHFFDKKVLKSLVEQKDCQLNGDLSLLTWALVCLSLWFKEFFD